MRENINKLWTFLLPVASLVLLIGCGDGGGGGDADAEIPDVPVEEADGAEDVQLEEIPGDPAVEDVVAEDVQAEEVVEEDVQEEEVISVTCPVVTSGTASLGGILTRGPNMNVVTTDTDLDAAGQIALAIFDQNPLLTFPRPDPVATGLIVSADLAAETDYVEFCVQNIPAGTYWFGALLDDDGSGFTDQEQFGDIITGPPLTGTLAADESVTDAHFVLNVRVGRVYGDITIDPTLASTHTDLTGNLYVTIVDAASVSPPPAILGGGVGTDVTLSPDGALGYQVLLSLEPTDTHTGVLVVIFDVDLSGVTTGPSSGDLVNFSLSVPITMPPSFSYTITGIDQNIDTEIISEY
jgi:hypothetical protein